MNRNFRILGVDPSASDDEIRQAYRQLSVKYSAGFFGDPMSETAKKRMKDIDDAFDYIMTSRRFNQQMPEPPIETIEVPFYTQVRRHINSNYLNEAETMLLQVVPRKRKAEWNFLMGCVRFSKGWLSEAAKYFAYAHTKSPHNTEYRTAYNNVFYGRQGIATGNLYQEYSTESDNSSVGFCETCCCLSYCTYECCWCLI